MALTLAVGILAGFVFCGFGWPAARTFVETVAGAFGPAALPIVLLRLAGQCVSRRFQRD